MIEPRQPESRPSRRTDVRARAHRRTLIAIAAASAAALWIGCSVEKHHEILSFFFDGVPDPHGQPGAGADGTGESAVMLSVHAPYANDACRECHESDELLLIDRNNADMCMKCHSEIGSVHQYMHGAVTGMACLWCHDPHSSSHEHLLRQRGPELCLSCHSQGMIDTSIVPHRDLSRSCLDCHTGHGGDARFFLRTDGETTADSEHLHESGS